jgi:hypothetical protein
MFELAVGDQHEWVQITQASRCSRLQVIPPLVAAVARPIS